MESGAPPPARYPPWLQVAVNAVMVRIRAKPGSSHREVIRVDADTIVVGVKSPPEKGRANQELTEYLALAAGVPRSAVTIARGAASRRKVIKIASSDPAQTCANLIKIAQAS